MLPNSKSELRLRLKSERNNLSALVASNASMQIARECIEIVPWGNIKSLHCYVPVWKEFETDSWHLFEYIWQKYPHIQTVVPRLNSDGAYDSVVVTPKTKWKMDQVRIPEPIDGDILDEKTQFDVVIVPMLGFDDTGHRLGHGKGWYDRFLAGQSGATTIGLCYEAGLVQTGLPHEPHDIALKYIVTERSVRKF